MSGVFNSFPTGTHANAAHFVLQAERPQPTAASLPVAILRAQDGAHLQTGVAIATTEQMLVVWEEWLGDEDGGKAQRRAGLGCHY